MAQWPVSQIEKILSRQSGGIYFDRNYGHNHLEQQSRAQSIHVYSLWKAPRRDRRSPPIGTVGDSFDNALAETVNGYYKAEFVKGPDHPGPWKTIAELELATRGSVHWHTNERLHGFIGDVPPTEFEEEFYAENRQEDVLAKNTTLGSL